MARGTFFVKPAARLLAACFFALAASSVFAATVEFSGYTWDVKSSGDLAVGPGPNFFAPDAVSVDAQGRLHLRMFNYRGKWQSAEVVLDRTLGYGRYEFVLGSPVDPLDANVVLGLFNWSDLPEQNHREIDIEFARWGNAKDPSNAQYVVQPHAVRGNLVRWSTSSAAQTRHAFDWQPGAVSFESHEGLQLLSMWRRQGFGVVSEPGDSRIHLNLWSFEGRAPVSGEPVEVVIDSFRFSPAK